MKHKNKRLMLVKYHNEDDVNRLDTCLKMCCMPHVIFKECDFADGTALWKIYIDRGRCTWDMVMREVNRVHPAKFNYVNDGSYITAHGLLCTPVCPTIHKATNDFIL